MISIFLAPVYFLINIYVVQWIFRWMGTCHYFFNSLLFRIVFAGFYIILATSLITGFLIKKPASLHSFLKRTGNYFLGTFMYIILIILIMDALRLFFKYGFNPSWIQYKETFVVSGAVCTLLIISLSLYGILHANSLQVTPYEITVNKKVQGNDSLKLVLLADTHFGYSIGQRQAEQLVEKINLQNPDLVCIAGDVFDNEYDAISDPEDIISILKNIKSKYGVYTCWGNHDISEPVLAGFTFHSSNKDMIDPRMEAFLNKANIRLLDDESVLIDNKFYLVGRKDVSRCKKTETTRLTPAQLTENLDKSKPIIFIDHQPKELQETADAGVDLDLCGHTHNGQIFPGNIIIHLFWENAYGYLKKDTMQNIVTSGAGVWGPNMRIGTDSEICPITVHFK